MVMQRLWSDKAWNDKAWNDKGSVTAELALAMPAVSLVIAITLGAFALQIERMKLVGVAAMAARAVARGETQENARALVLEMNSTADSQQINLEIQTRENTVCVNLSRNFEIAGLPGKLFDFSELQCARKVGL
jgi:Flp pilus assembly protein TadG